MKNYAHNLISLIHEHIGSPVAGAEIGVWKGATSAELCKAFPACRLHMVDTWKSWPPGTPYHSEHQQMGKLTQEEWDVIAAEAVRSVNAVGGLYTLHAMTSDQAAKGIKDLSLDFVFLDANHVYEDVKKDIELWYPKVRPGGLISGHDYQGLRDRIGQWGVSKAVHEAFGKERVIPPVGNSRVWAVKKD